MKKLYIKRDDDIELELPKEFTVECIDDHMVIHSEDFFYGGPMVPIEVRES